MFRKREALYGLPGALEPMRSAGRAIVVEGYFDQIAMVQAGLGEAVATCGTALTEEHAKSLVRRTRNVVLLFDGDEAGQRAMLRALEVLLPAGLRVRAAALPGGADPDDFLRREGAEALRRLVDEAKPALEVAILRAAAAGCRTPWERADAVRRGDAAARARARAGRARRVRAPARARRRRRTPKTWPRRCAASARATSPRPRRRPRAAWAPKIATTPRCCAC